MFEHLDDSMDPTPAPVERIIRRGRRMQVRRRAAVGAACGGVAVVAASATAALASNGAERQLRVAERGPTTTAPPLWTTARRHPPRTTTTIENVATTVVSAPTVPTPSSTTPTTMDVIVTFPTTLPHADLVTTVTPSHMTAHANDVVTVMLAVTNNGSAAGEYTYWNDGCGPSVYHRLGAMCSQNVQQFVVPAGTTVAHSVDIHVNAAPPGTYDVSLGTVSVTVVVVK